MDVDTKGCVVTKTKDVFEVVRVINGKVKAVIEQESGVRGFRVNLSENFRLPSVRVSEVSNSLSFNFKFKGEERQLLVHFDCDKDLINPDAVKILETRGGFHVIIRLGRIAPQYVKSWYKNITSLPGADIAGDTLIPIPGTYQGGFVPHLFDMEDFI